MEGCTGWPYVTEELAAVGIAAHVGEPWPRSPPPAAASGTPRPTRPIRGISGRCWPRAGCPGCWIPPAQYLEYRALLETYHDLRREHTAWVQRIHAVFFHQGAPALGQGTLRTEQGLARLREAAAAHLSPGGQLPPPPPWDMLAAVEARMEVLRTQLRDAARDLTGAKVLAARLYGVGPVTALALTCWLAGEGRFSSSQGGPVHRAGCHRLVFGPQGTARAPVPPGAAGAALGGL